MSSPPQNLFRWAAWRLLLCLIAVAVLVVLFYQEEDWRGRRAWENCRRDLAAKGESVDWKDFVPPPLPDQSNILKAPMMKEWFGGVFSTNGNISTNSPVAPLRAWHETPLKVAQVTIVPLLAEARLKPGDADIILRYVSPGAAFFPRLNSDAPSDDEVVPIVSFDAASLSDGVRALALQAGMKNLIFDPSVDATTAVTLKWGQLTVMECLQALLNNAGLRLVEYPVTSVKRVERKPENSWKAFMPDSVHAALGILRDRMLGPVAVSPIGDFILKHPVDQTAPVRIILISDTPPPPKEIEGFFHDYLAGPGSYLSSEVQVTSTGAGSFDVFKDDACAAADYLKRCKVFETNLDLIREALRRPAVQREDYQNPIADTPNYVAMRQMAQALAAQAQCHLLLNEPGRALEKLTLMHDSTRLLDARPATVVQSMMKAAVDGLYAAKVEDGLRSHAWREPELVALEEQLRDIDLPADLTAASRAERAHLCEAVANPVFAKMEENKLREMFPRPAAVKSITASDIRQSVLNRAYNLMPSGWLLQNLAHAAIFRQECIEAVDPAKGLFFPGRATLYDSELERAGRNPSPFLWMYGMYYPSFSRPLIITARNQTLLNQDRVVYALERYHLATGRYPASQEELAPRFIDRLPHDLIGGQPLRYRRTGPDGFLLYSIGWNEKDDGGVAGQSSSNREGDWVWGAEP